MSWHVRYIDPALKHDMLSPEFETKDVALDHAWALAQDEKEITAIEGPDEELLSTDEIALWFEEKQARQNKQA